MLEMLHELQLMTMFGKVFAKTPKAQRLLIPFLYQKVFFVDYVPIHEGHSPGQPCGSSQSNPSIAPSPKR
jgi:hypothetical protein